MGEEQKELGMPSAESLNHEGKRYSSPVLIIVEDRTFVVTPERGRGVLDKTRVHVFPFGKIEKKATVTSKATIGRVQGNDFRINDPFVSAVHATIESLGSGAFIIRDDSKHGTEVQPITEVPPGKHTLERGIRSGPYLVGDNLNIILGERLPFRFIMSERGAYLEDYVSKRRTAFGEDSDEALITIGRDSDNALSLPTMSLVSRQHALLEYMHGVFFITDLLSRNGTALWSKVQAENLMSSK